MSQEVINHLELTHQDKKAVAMAAKAIKKNGLLAEFVPLPEIYTFADMTEEEKKQATRWHKAKTASEWKSNNWGTTNELSLGAGAINEVSIESGVLALRFTTASVPGKAYMALRAKGFSVRAYHYTKNAEDSKIVVGRIILDEKNEINENFSLDRPDSKKWIEKNIPNDINDIFSLSSGSPYL